MKLSNKKLGLVLLAFMSFTIAKSQVYFKLDLLPDNKTYQLTMVPEQSWSEPMNTASTFQATVKVPTDRGFEMGELNSLVEGLYFAKSGYVKSPDEAPEYEYFTFSFIRPLTKQLKFEQHKEVPLFTFTNLGECPGPVELIENNQDPFSYPNSERLMIGNYLSVAGAGGDAYRGVVEGHKIANCADLEADEADLISYFDLLQLFPNPAVDESNLVYWISEKAQGNHFTIEVVDNLGRVEISQKVDSAKGKHNLTLQLGKLAPGTYYVKLAEKDGMVKTRKLIIIKE